MKQHHFLCYHLVVTYFEISYLTIVSHAIGLQDSCSIEKGKKTEAYSIFDDSIINLLKEDLFTLIDKSREHKYWLENKDKIINGKSTVKYELNDVLNN